MRPYSKTERGTEGKGREQNSPPFHFLDVYRRKLIHNSRAVLKLFLPAPTIIIFSPAETHFCATGCWGAWKAAAFFGVVWTLWEGEEEEAIASTARGIPKKPNR